MSHKSQLPETNSLSAMEHVVLPSDNGTVLEFTGRIFSETSFYDEDSGVLTRFRLYLTSEGLQAYSIISSTQGKKERRAYTVKVEGSFCTMSDGLHTLRLPADALFAAVFGLCGLDASRAEGLRTTFDEALRLAIG